MLYKFYYNIFAIVNSNYTSKHCFYLFQYAVCWKQNSGFFYELKSEQDSKAQFFLSANLTSKGWFASGTAC